MRGWKRIGLDRIAPLAPHGKPRNLIGSKPRPIASQPGQSPKRLPKLKKAGDH